MEEIDRDDVLEEMEEMEEVEGEYPPDWTAEASNPAEVRINYVRYFFSRSQPFLVFALLIAVLAAASALLTLWILIGLALVLAVFALYLLRLRAQFRNGCVNPGVIVSERPCLVAVFTDLTRDGEVFWP